MFVCVRVYMWMGAHEYKYVFMYVEARDQPQMSFHLFIFGDRNSLSGQADWKRGSGNYVPPPLQHQGNKWLEPHQAFCSGFGGLNLGLRGVQGKHFPDWAIFHTAHLALSSSFLILAPIFIIPFCLSLLCSSEPVSWALNIFTEICGKCLPAHAVSMKFDIHIFFRNFVFFLSPLLSKVWNFKELFFNSVNIVMPKNLTMPTLEFPDGPLWTESWFPFNFHCKIRKHLPGGINMPYEPS